MCCDVGRVVVGAGMMVTGWVWRYGRCWRERATCVYRGVYRQVYCAVQPVYRCAALSQWSRQARPAPSVSRFKSPSPDTSLASHSVNKKLRRPLSHHSPPAGQSCYGPPSLDWARRDQRKRSLTMIRGQGRAGPQWWTIPCWLLNLTK